MVTGMERLLVVAGAVTLLTVGAVASPTLILRMVKLERSPTYRLVPSVVIPIGE
jgi:hypothetical protein